MSKHTAGPWIVDPDHPQDISPADDLRLGVASICNSDNIDGRWVFAEVSRANAALVAAAPDLLNALKAMVHKATKQNWNDSYPVELQAAFDAIAKATGESK